MSWASLVVPLATAAAGYFGEKKGDTSSSNIDKTSESNPWSPSQGYRLWAMRRAFEQMNRGADAPPDWLYSGRRRKGQNRTNPDTLSNHGFPGPNDLALMGLGGPGGGGGSLASSFGRDSVLRRPNGDVVDPRTGEILSGPRQGETAEGYGEDARRRAPRGDVGFSSGNVGGGSPSWYTHGTDPRIEGSRYESWSDVPWKKYAKALGLFF